MSEDTPLPAPEENNAFGVAMGLESEDTGDIAKPFDPEDIDVITKPMTIDLLLSRIHSKAINLQPDFQRRWGIWDVKRQSRLIESLLLRIPVPSLYAAEDQNEDWEIVDGVQRLYTIARFIDSSLVSDTPLVLSQLTTLANFNGRSFNALPTKLQRRLRETELVVHVIRKGTPPAVKYSIFERINTGSVVLSAQELRHAITPGLAREILEGWAGTNEFKEATDFSVRSDRMGDRELVLRFVAFRLTPYTDYKVQDFDAFLLTAMSSLNILSAKRLGVLELDFKGSMTTATAVFGRHAFRKRYRLGESRYPINKALFEATAVNLAALMPQQRDSLVKYKDIAQEKLMHLCNNREFEAAISQGTGDVTKVRRRFEMVASVFQEVVSNA
jgi:hypothetical protein